MGMKKDFEEATQKIWATRGLENKRQLLIEMVNSFAVKNEGKFAIHEMRFMNAATSAQSANEIDRIATNIMMGKDMKVI